MEFNEFAKITGWSEFDIEEVLKYGAKPKPAPPDARRVAPGFALQDIKDVLNHREGANDGPSWLLVVSLNNGRFGYVEAVCDYSGWDWQESGYSAVAETYENLVRFGLGREAREEFGLQW